MSALPPKRIEELPPTVLESRDHVFPAMRDGIANRISIAQILGLLERGDLEGLLFAEDSAFAPAGTGLVAQTVQAALAELAARARVETQVFGQCRLALDGSNLRLSRFNGRWLTIDGVRREIPSAGVALAPTGLSADTVYYIYAEWTGSAIALVASTTARATDTTNGMQVQSGNAARTLVGMAQPVSGPAWVNSGTQRYVRSWFNDPGISLQGTFSTNRSTTSTTNVEIDSEIRISFLIWAGETIVFQMSGGAVRNSANGGGVHTLFAIDGTTAEALGGCYFANPTGQTGAQGALSGVRTRATLSEGSHFATLVGRVNTGTATWEGGSDIGVHLSAITTGR